MRALGLDLFRLVFNSIFPFLKRRPPAEQKKVALQKNRWIASSRCVIHIIPCTISLVLTVLNIRGFYLGAELPGTPNQDAAKLGALQLGAKVHELSIHASIATMVYTYLRYELTLGAGVPLGALHAGQRFSELSYLWSIEFWGVISSRRVHASWLRELCFGLGLVTAIFLAALAAPASAIALIPRWDGWPAFGTSFWINGSNDQLFPGQVNASHIGRETCLTLGSDLDLNCPSGGYPEIKSFSTFFRDRSVKFVAGRTLPAFGQASTRYTNVTLKFGRNMDSITTATTPQLAVSDAMVMAAAPGPWLKYKYTGTNFYFMREALIRVESRQPLTRVQCSDIRLHGGTTPSPLQFPNFMPFGIEYKSLTLNATRNIWDAAIPKLNATTGIYLGWVDLPETEFTNSTMGALIVFPSSRNSSSIVYSTCNIDSRWAPSIIWRFKNTLFNVWGSPSGVEGYDLGRRQFDWPWRTIKTSIDWANALIPPISSSSNAPTTFASIAETAGIDATIDPTHPQVVEAILAMLFSDGLARISSTSTLQGHLKGGSQLGDSPSGAEWGREMLHFGDAWTLDPGDAALATSQRWLKLRLECLAVGYAYSSQGLAIKLALIVLLLHVFLAAAHIAYSLTTGLSSSSWDSATEITMLAMNSTPSGALRNTCAGIERVATMGLAVQIVEAREDGKGNEHLELTVGDDSRLKKLDSDGVRMRTGKEYG